MEVMTLECRADRLFGRHVDLARLRERASHTGMTAIVGAPQIGKSWVLMELARQLDRVPAVPPESERPIMPPQQGGEKWPAL